MPNAKLRGPGSRKRSLERSCLLILLWAFVLCTPAEAVDWQRWQALMDEAIQFSSKAEFRNALPAVSEAVEIARQAGPREGRLAESLDIQGSLLFHLGEYQAAENALLGAIAIWRPLPRYHLRLGQALAHLAFLYRETGRPGAEVESLSREALAVADVGEDRDMPATAAMLSRLTVCLMDRKKFQEAEAHLRRAEQIIVRHRHPALASEIYLNAGTLAFHQRQYAQALAALDQAKQFAAQSNDFRGALKILLLITQGAVLLKLRRSQESDAALAEAAEIAVHIYGPEHIRMAEILLLRAGSLKQLGQRREAKQTESRAKTITAAHQAESRALQWRTSVSALVPNRPGH